MRKLALGLISSLLFVGTNTGDYIFATPPQENTILVNQPLGFQVLSSGSHF